MARAVNPASTGAPTGAACRRGQRRVVRRGLAATALMLPVLLHAPVGAAKEKATVQEILDGRELYIDQQQARVKDQATAPQEISTRDSRGQIRFDSGAAGRVNRFSQLRLGSSCFLLTKGQILVSGPQSGCTRSSRLSVRGTNYVVEVNDDTQEAELSVLEGAVEVEPLKDGEPTGAPATRVEAGQKVRLSPQGVILTLLKLSSGDYSSILGGPLFEGFREPLPGFGSLESYIRSYVPGVNIPSAPSVPSLPISLPRFF